MARLFKLAIAASALAVAAARVSHTSSSSSCNGQSFCQLIVDGLEFADLNGTTPKCLFGQTAVGLTDHCDVPCHGDVTFNCTCLSEEISRQNIEREASVARGASLGLAALGLVGLCIITFVFAVTCSQGKAGSKPDEKFNIAPIQTGPPPMAYNPPAGGVPMPVVQAQYPQVQPGYGAAVPDPSANMYGQPPQVPGYGYSQPAYGQMQQPAYGQMQQPGYGQMQQPGYGYPQPQVPGMAGMASMLNGYDPTTSRPTDPQVPMSPLGPGGIRDLMKLGVCYYCGPFVCVILCVSIVTGIVSAVISNEDFFLGCGQDPNQ